MSSFLQGAKFILVNGKPLLVSAVVPSTTSISLVPWVVRTASGYTTRFQVHTSAASADTTGNVPILFSWTGGRPAKIEARITQSGTVIVPWTDITSSVSFNGTTQSGIGLLPNVPVGIGYKREVRVGTLTDVDALSHNIGVMALLWGQSNMTGLLAGSGYPLVPNTSMDEKAYFAASGVGAFYTPYGFAEGGDNNITVASHSTYGGGMLSFLRLVGTALEAKHGKKVGFAIHPRGSNGSGMSQFMSQAGVIPVLGSTSTVAGGIGFSPPPQYLPTGDYRMVLWHQGETLDYYTSTRADRLRDLKLFVKAHLAQVAQFGRQPNQIAFLFAMMGVVTSSSAQHIEILRGAVIDLMNDPEAIAGGWDIRIGVNCVDLDPATFGDGLHMGGSDLRLGMRRFISAAMNVVNPTMVPYGSRGPKLTGAYVRNGNDVKFTVEQEGGTALAAKDGASAITGWYANTAADFTGTYLTVSNVVINDATHVTVTLDSAPSTFYVKHCGGKAIAAYDVASYHPTVSNLIYDNLVYPAGVAAADQFTGRPLLPTPDAIKVG